MSKKLLEDLQKTIDSSIYKMEQTIRIKNGIIREYKDNGDIDSLNKLLYVMRDGLFKISNEVFNEIIDTIILIDPDNLDMIDTVKEMADAFYAYERTALKILTRCESSTYYTHLDYSNAH